MRVCVWLVAGLGEADESGGEARQLIGTITLIRDDITINMRAYVGKRVILWGFSWPVIYV